MQRLEGKTALISGAASGIGRASAILFAQQGANIVVLDRARAVEETANLIRGARAVQHHDVGALLREQDRKSVV